MSTFTIPVMQRQTAIMFVIAPTLWASKAAILALYIRIFGSVTWLRRTSWIGIVCMALFYSLNIVAAGVYCLPRRGELWGPGVFARCAESTWLHVVVGVFSCIADLVILILPFPVVMRLRISLVKKVPGTRLRYWCHVSYPLCRSQGIVLITSQQLGCHECSLALAASLDLQPSRFDLECDTAGDGHVSLAEPKSIPQ
jgi:hypothetical protein